jgi:toluene monooxygenase system protein A
MDRDDWLELTRQLDWDLTYVREDEVYPPEIAGGPWLPGTEWAAWDEPFRTTYGEYVVGQHDKDVGVQAVRDAVGQLEDFQRLDRAWLSALKFHAATLALAEFSAVVGNLRAARFGRHTAWRTMSLLGALDELRHTQIPLLLMHDLVRWDAQFDWTHRFYHTNDWVAIAARHLFDELLLGTDPIEFAVATNFVFETGFTNLQFVGLSALAHNVGDRMFEKMVQSIQTDEARHAQIGPSVLAILVKHDRARAQAYVDKWFWRSWLLFSVVTGFSMDYLTPVAHRTASFAEFVQEWVLDQFERSLSRFGLSRPWYWDTFLESIQNYHHMVYVSAYTYRATVWFDMSLPGPEERRWLRAKYPSTWEPFERMWERVSDRWREGGPGLEWYVHGVTPVTFCRLCQLVLCGGTPAHNTARTVNLGGESYIFCSAPCERIFMENRERYAPHRDVVQRILAGAAPANLLELLRLYFDLHERTWGKDVASGNYSWMGATGKE